MTDVAERLTKILENDSSGAIKRTLRVAQSDIIALLSQFMELDKLDMVAERTENGYKLRISADVDRFTTSEISLRALHKFSPGASFKLV